jgi:tetraprenyl-beta-curcumene synthase
MSALGTYVVSVLPGVRRELRRWRRQAESITGQEARGHALSALDEKASNVEAVAVFATLAPRRHRDAALRAIAALQIGIDYLDNLEEAGCGDRHRPGDGGYMSELDATWEREVASLPSAEATLPLIRRAVERCGEGQRHTHDAARGSAEELRRWAAGLKAPTSYRWWEVGAGASSSVAAHALIAAAADPRTSGAAAADVDAAYFPSIGALTVLLDDLVDRERDRAAGEHSYLDYYEDSAETAGRLAVIAGLAAAQLRHLPRSRRHGAILAGVASFYLSAPETETAFARPVRRSLLGALGPGTGPLTSFMRLRRLGNGKRPEPAGSRPGP